MPNAFARPCSFAGCKNTAPARFCPAHAQLVAKEFDRQRRSDPVRRLYFTSRWAHVRLSVLARDPICLVCRQVASAEADHIVPAQEWVRSHAGNIGDFFDEANLQGLCKSCHSSKTARECGFAMGNG